MHHEYLTVLDECALHLAGRDLSLRIEALHLKATACMRLNQSAAALPLCQTLLTLDAQAAHWLVVRAAKPEVERRRWFTALYEAVDAEGRMMMDALAIHLARDGWR